MYPATSSTFRLAGMSLLTVFMGLTVTLTGIAGYPFPPIRDVEILLPDHSAVAPPDRPA